MVLQTIWYNFPVSVAPKKSQWAIRNSGLQHYKNENLIMSQKYKSACDFIKNVHYDRALYLPLPSR